MTPHIIADTPLRVGIFYGVNIFVVSRLRSVQSPYGQIWIVVRIQYGLSDIFAENAAVVVFPHKVVG